MSGFDFQPTLSGDLIRMRPYTEGDWDALFAEAQDPAIWAIHPIHDRWKEPVFRHTIAEAMADQGGLVAIEQARGEVVGFSRYSCLHAEKGEVEIGWSFLATRLWGGLYNRDMKRQMLAHALATFPTVIFRVGENNLRSRGAMEKIGGVLTDRISIAHRGDEALVHVTYAITRESFAAGPLA